MTRTIVAVPASEYHEDMGDVMWWRGMPPEEAPWIGNPNCLGYTVELHSNKGLMARGMAGGWPGDDYFTHFSIIPRPVLS